VNISANPFSVDFPIANELLQNDDVEYNISAIEEKLLKE